MSEQITRQYTLAEALERAARKPPADADASRDASDEWAGGSYEAAMRMAFDGDKRAALLLKQKVGAFAKFRSHRRPTQRWGESGSTVDVGRYLSGETENMVETVPAKRPSPVIKLAIERAVSANTSADTMASTGASVLAVVEALRTAGVPAEVWVTFTQGRASKMSVQVLIQRAGRPIDVDRLAFWVINPSAFRRVGFAIEEQEPYEDRLVAGIQDMQSYGSPMMADKDDFDEVAPARADQVTTWIREVLARRAGITYNEE